MRHFKQSLFEDICEKKAKFVFYLLSYLKPYRVQERRAWGKYQRKKALRDTRLLMR